MKLGVFFDRAIDVGIQRDPRGVEGVDNELSRINAEYAALGERDKQWFDKERLTNPFVDARILYGSKDIELKRITVGIDADNTELLLVNELRKKGERIDAVMNHHPCARSANFHHALEVQVDMFEEWGIPLTQAESLIRGRIGEVSRSILPRNLQRLPRTAELLDIPLLYIHTPADNCVQKHVQGTVDKAEPRTINDLIELLTDSYQEYYKARCWGEAMKIFVGKKKYRCGKIIVKMTGGTQGPKEQFAAFAKAGIGTMVCMHLSEEARKEAEKNNINVLVAGHMASDSIGMNLIIANVDPKGKIEVIPISGLIYVDRR